MASFSTEYPFEEIKLAGDALMAWGTATLTSAGEDYPGEFYVSKIVLDNGLVLRPKGVGELGFMDTFRAELFNRISALVESDEHAQRAYSEAEAGHDDAPKLLPVSVTHGTYSAVSGHVG